MVDTTDLKSVIARCTSSSLVWGIWFHSLTVKQNPFKILSADSTSAGAIVCLNSLGD